MEELNLNIKIANEDIKKLYPDFVKENNWMYSKPIFYEVTLTSGTKETKCIAVGSMKLSMMINLAKKKFNSI